MALRSNAVEALLREMQAIVRLAAEPRVAADSTKAAIARAGQALSLNYRRAYSLWYRADRLRVSPEEAARLRAEGDRLLVRRIERLQREIDETKRLLAQAEQRDAVAAKAAGLARGPAQPGCPAGTVTWGDGFL